MPIRQKIFAIIMGALIFFAIIELVRRKRLRLEYSWLWLLTGVTILTLTFSYDLLLFLTKLIGAVSSTTTLLLFAFLLLLSISLHFSVRISSLQTTVKMLSQEIALLRAMRQEEGIKPADDMRDSPD